MTCPRRPKATLRACAGTFDKVAHCKTLVDLLAARGVTAVMLTGDLPAADRRKVVAALNRGQVKVLVATGALLGEGFDCRELSTLFLTTPIKSLSVNNTNFSPADNGCCQMMQGDITGIGFLKAKQKLTKPVEP
jgi:hypothetical protein